MTVAQESRPARGAGDPAPPAATVPAAQVVLLAAVGMIATALAYRAWALYNSWFYLDDYRLLFQADQATWSVRHLADPFDSQLMPLGRLVVKTVAASGPADWRLAASITLGMQLLASAACLWMLLALFGRRWGVLALLGLYLCLALTAPAFMWWAAALNQVPLQAVVFGAVAAWATYLRTDRPRWLLVTLAIVGLGLLSYVKTLLLLPFLVLLALAYFTEGGPPRRLLTLLRDRWLGLTALAVLGSGYLAYYLTHVPSISSTPSLGAARGLARTMLGSTLPTGLVGGPWTWSSTNPPVALADPPGWTVAVSWVVIALVVGAAVLRRRRAAPAFVLLAVHVAGVYLLALTARAVLVGTDVGREPRYLTDVVPVAVVCLGLALLPLRGSRQGSTPRPGSREDARWPTRAAGVLVVAACLGGLVSTTVYVRVWHTDNPGEEWTAQAQAGLSGQGPVAVADDIVPDDVVAGFNFPWNTLGRVLPVVVDDVTFPTVTDDLVTFEATGVPRRALIDPATTSVPGPQPDCGWRVDGGRSVTVPLQGDVPDFDWWVRIGYLASEDATGQVTTGDVRTPVEVRRGLHSLFLRVDTAMSEVVVAGLPDSTALCVDVVEVGTVVPGGPL